MQRANQTARRWPLARGDNSLAQNNKTACWKLAHMKPDYRVFLVPGAQ
jgi:hypothetical protein